MEKSKIISLILGIIVLCAILGLVYYYFFSSGSDEQSGSATTLSQKPKPGSETVSDRDSPNETEQ